jgi:hypothetical protein
MCELRLPDRNLGEKDFGLRPGVQVSRKTFAVHRLILRMNFYQPTSLRSVSYENVASVWVASVEDLHQYRLYSMDEKPPAPYATISDTDYLYKISDEFDEAAGTKERRRNRISSATKKGRK